MAIDGDHEPIERRDMELSGAAISSRPTWFVVENHLHGGVFLVHERAVVGAVIENHAEALRIEVSAIGHLHSEIRAWHRQNRQHDSE